MTTAICLTPDRRFFGPALCVAQQILDRGLPAEADILILCEAADIWPRVDGLDRPLRDRIRIVPTSFAPLIGAAPATANGSHAIYRRLVLDRMLPRHYDRVIAIDSDVIVSREGLGPLIELDLGGHALAAAIDMIFYMDMGGPLGPEFRAHRMALGLDPAIPYFNNGLVVIERAAWERQRLGERAIELIVSDPRRFPWFDQDALNILLVGDFVPLSPRFNFMGDFLLLDLEREIAPIVYHFVNRPKPWERGFAGDPRFAEMFYRWFASSPWPDFAAAPAALYCRPLVNLDFRTNLLGYLDHMHFADTPGGDRERH